MHDFHEEVTFKQKFYLHQQFMFFCVNCLCLFYLFIYFFVCVCVCVGGGGGCVFRILQN